MTSHSDTHPDDNLALRIVRLESQLLAAQQENARLREALSEMIEYAGFALDVLTGKHAGNAEQAIEAARAALRGGEGGHG